MPVEMPVDSRTLCCIGVASCLGGARPGCEQGPDVLWGGGLAGVLQRNGWKVALNPLVPEAGEPEESLARVLRRLADTAAAGIQRNEFPLILGGDHSIAAGTWRGIGRALGKPPGMLWIDAHLDAHTPETSPTGNLHGMPVAALLGLGSQVLTGIPGPALDPSTVVLIGARSYESEEWLHLQERGVRIVTAAEIGERGLAAIIAEALPIVSRNGPWGLSLDVDALDPSVAGAVSTPAPGGLELPVVMEALHGMMRTAGCCACELTEFNPVLDHDGQTARAVLDLLGALSSLPDTARTVAVQPPRAAS